ncbi:MAG: efflux RND transporter permease subunit [Planctomycetes bacterium]|nr:efflux RND transporter permease subunit [Planctomycetota bacterium]
MSDTAPAKPSRFFQLVTTRPVAVLCVVAAFVVFGGVAYGKLKTTLMPNLEYPQLTIRTGYPAAAPSEVEEKVSQRIEERLGNVPGLLDRSSISRAESSDVLLKFGWGTDMLAATADVRDRLDRIGFDDDEVQRPQILRYDPAQDPTMRLMLFSTDRRTDLLELRAFAEDILKPELSKIDGVAAVRVSGGQERQIRISLSEARLNQYGLTAAQVQGRIRQARVDSSAGLIELAGRDVILRVVSTYESLEVLKDLEVATGDQGRITLNDLATEIDYVPRERETITRFIGAETGYEAREGVLLEVLKEGDANIVETAKRVWIALYGATKYKEIRDKRGEVDADEAKGGTTQVQQGGSRGGFRGGRRGGGFGGGGGSFFSGQRSLIDQLPEGFGLQVISDQSYFIEDAVEDVTASAVLGAFLAVMVLFLFLRSVKATVLIAAAIPLSIVTTFIPMQMTDVSMNLMSLGGLALGIGMLVDNSVVVIESIARCREEGDHPLQAAVRGISEVGGAILASTMTTVAVFLPIIFVEGVAGQIFRDLSLTVVFSLLASLIVAQFVVPAMFGLSFGAIGKGGAFATSRKLYGYPLRTGESKGLRRGLKICLRLFYIGSVILMIAVPVGILIAWFGPAGKEFMSAGAERTPEQTQAFGVALALWVLGTIGGVSLLVLAVDAMVWVARYVWKGFALVFGLMFKPVSLAFEAVWKAIDALYPVVLRGAIAQPLLVVVGVIVAGGLALGVGSSLETELLPKFQQDELYFDIAAPDGTQINDADVGASGVAMAAFKDEFFRDQVSRATIEVGGEEQAGDSRPVGSHRARMVVTLKHAAEAGDVLPAIQQTLRGSADDTTLFQESSEFGAPALVKLDTGLQIEVRGDDYVTLGEAAERLVRALRAIEVDGKPLLKDVRSSLQAGRPQVQLSYDRAQLQRYGLSADGVTSEVRNKIGGAISTTFSSGGEALDVFVELAKADKKTLEQVRDLEVARGVRLRNVLVNDGADLRVTEGPSEIRRVGNQRAVVVFAEPNGVALSRAAGVVRDMLEGGGVDTGSAQVAFAGQVEEMESSILGLILALLLAVFLVYVVMAVQFESLIDPLVIMFSVPFAAAGVVLALGLFGLPVSVMVLLGCIVLAGIVVNNAIVLVNYANQLRARGQGAKEAATNAARIRLRPIAITTLTTLLGLVPMTGWLDPFMPAAQAVAGVVDGAVVAVVEGVGRSVTAPADWALVGGWKFSFVRGLEMLAGGGEGAEVRKPLAITVIAGLASSTVLTLVVIPTLWAWVNILQGRIKLRRQTP